MVRTILGLVVLVAFLSACSLESPDAAPSDRTASAPRGGESVLVQLAQKPEITVKKILTDIVGQQVRANDAAGEAQPMDWKFEQDEPKHAEILEQQAKDNSIALIIQMNTGGAPGSDDANVQLTGRLRLHYEWNGQDWLLRRIENVTFRYSRRMWI
jgi:hypothetical protein